MCDPAARLDTVTVPEDVPEMAFTLVFPSTLMVSVS